MTLPDTLMIFAGGFACVFTLAFQSRAVNAGNYLTAATMSFVVAMSQAHLWKLVIENQGDLLASSIYGASGSCAIVLAMWVHHRFFTRKAAETE